MARSLREAMGQDSMVNQLLRIMGNAAHVAGDSGRNVKQKLNDQADVTLDKGDAFATKVADARFLLGADDGAYLRSNVMPLQTADGNCDTRTLSSLPPELQRSGQLGVLEAVAEHLKKQRRSAAEKLKDSFSLCGWLLSIKEVSAFVNAYLNSLVASGAVTPALTQALALANAFQSSAADLSSAAKDLIKSDNESGACELLKIVLVLFDVPMDTVDQQWEATLGKDGTGTAQLQEGLRRLSLSAQLLKSAFVAEQVKQPALEIKLRTIRATSLNLMTTGRVDYSITEMPPGWDDSEEDVTDDSFEDSANRMRRLLQKRKDLAATINPTASLDEVKVQIQEERNELDKLLAEAGLAEDDERKDSPLGRKLNIALKAVMVKTQRLVVLRAVQNLREKGINPQTSLPLLASESNEAVVEYREAIRKLVQLETEYETALKNNLKAEEAERLEALAEAARQEQNLLSAEQKAAQETERAKSKVAVQSGIEQSPTFCQKPSAIGNTSDSAVDGLCAAISQLREDGGASYTADGQLVRTAGISPFFERRLRAPQGDFSKTGYWASNLWPKRPPTTDATGNLFEKLPKTASFVQTPGSNSIAYALARGLCSERAPHHVVPSGAKSLKYTIPLATFPGNVADGGSTISEDEKLQTRNMFASSTIAIRSDFVNRPFFDGDPRREVARPVKWAPVSFGPTAMDSNKNAFGPNYDGQDYHVHAAVATAAVYEHMVDDYTAAHDEAMKEATELTSKALLALGCAAASKIKQLHSMATVFGYDADLSTLCVASPAPAEGEKHHFMTRPVLRCPGRFSKVLYPCDAGLAAYKEPNLVEVSATKPSPYPLKFGEAYGRLNEDGERNVGNRDAMTLAMRSALTDFKTKSADASTEVPLYIAQPPGAGAAEKIADDTVSIRGEAPAVRSVRTVESTLPITNPDSVAKDNLATALRLGVKQCAILHQLECEEQAIKRAKSGLTESAGEPDREARLRRDAVWNDSLREACISGDRLYAFVRQLSGTISEQVDAVCMIDEGMLVQQQKQERERESRLSDRAAQEHMQLVRSVFSNVIRESGLTLGIGNTGSDLGQLKVVSNTLRKQASELASGSSTGDGFFANSVRLENLLEKGTGEMTLEQLFAELKDAGRALQEAADASTSTGNMTVASTTLDFLSAPRNSLLLRYKPEALAAMRQAFDVFQREMMAQHGRMYRTITAYELIEGNDESLCSAFAQFSAHMLVHSRMYSSATAMYVAAWPAAANAQQLKVSLQRLVRIACEYLSYTEAPNFLSATGRGSYFRQPGAPMGLALAPRYLVPNNMFSLDLYGSGSRSWR